MGDICQLVVLVLQEASGVHTWSVCSPTVCHPCQASDDHGTEVCCLNALNGTIY